MSILFKGTDPGDNYDTGAHWAGCECATCAPLQKRIAELAAEVSRLRVLLKQKERDGAKAESMRLRENDAHFDWDDLFMLLRE